MSKELERTSGIIIPKSHDLYPIISNDLTKIITDYSNNTKILKFFHEEDDHILIPRFYNISSDYTVIDNSSEGADIDIESKITPWSDRQAKAMNDIATLQSAVFELEPGSGKTEIAVEGICRIKKKALILVHKIDLGDQWIQRFLAKTNISEDEIGKMSSSNYKKVLNKSIIICTVQSLANVLKNKNKDFEKAIREANIGILIVDECHIGVGPEVFSLASLVIPARRVFGLSATPYRSDGMNEIITYHLGEHKTYPVDKSKLETLTPIVYMIKFPYGIYSRYSRYLNFGGMFNMARYYKQMVKIDFYSDTISKLIVKAFANNRKILVMGKNVKPQLELARKCNLPKDKVGVFIPSTTEKDRLTYSDICDLKQAFLTKDVIFTTDKACRDGNNRPELDCLFMVTPIQNIKQACGRVNRSNEGKKIPLVFDFVDTEGPRVNSFLDRNVKVGFFERMAEKRYADYIKLGWEVKEITINKP